MAAESVSGPLSFSVNFQQLSTLTNPTGTLSAFLQQAFQYVNATGAIFGVDQLYVAQGSLVSTTKTFHFQTGVLNDPFGNALAMLRIRELIVANLNTTLGQDLKVEAPASNGITWLPPTTAPLYARSGNATGNGGLIRISDPASFGGGVGNVVGATSDGMELDSGANTISYLVIALGCSVA
jgi:hypothetical protein